MDHNLFTAKSNDEKRAKEAHGWKKIMSTSAVTGIIKQ